MKIIFRACDVVNSLHGSVDGSFNPRPFNLPKKEIIKIAARSLKESVQGSNHEFYLVGDRVSDDTWSFLSNLLNPVYSFNSKEKLGDGGSLLHCSRLAMDFADEDLIYFAEDDYLHNPQTFLSKLNAFFKFAEGNLSNPWFIHPTDYPDQYARLLNRCYIFQTETGYWREVFNTTHTFMVRKKDYAKFVDFFRECHAEDGNDGKLSTIFGKDAFCFSPLPGIATHMHSGTYSNYVDWATMIKDFASEGIDFNQS